jgi:hypothetical protein
VIGTLLALVATVFASSSAFVVATSVENRSDRVVRVALLGVAEGGGIVPLPLRKWGAFAEAPRFVELAPGASHQFSYDWDDINFCWIVVSDERGYRIQRTGMDPVGCPEDGVKAPCCGTPALTQVVTDVSALPIAPPAVAHAASQIP